MKNPFEGKSVWFITGSQHLYGEETLKEVAKDAQKIAKGLSSSAQVPVQVIARGVVTTSQEILKVVREANQDDSCVGIALWMHTFSPAKMWIAGLQEMAKPFVHFHTQFYREIPWDSIDMDYMNLHQSAHGGREFGHIVSRMRINRHVIAGHWQEDDVQKEFGDWARVAVGCTEAKSMKVARFGDNMRTVAVTDGDKVSAQQKFGMVVDGYGIMDLVDVMNSVGEDAVDRVIAEYEGLYEIEEACRKGNEKHATLREEARVEIALRTFLDAGGYTAFTTTFEDLHGMKQLPGLAVQRLMADGYGFGGEGDWKTAAMTHIMKVIGYGTGKGTSFMEDYTYHFTSDGGKVLGAHMLEVCPSIARGKVKISVQPLGIGGKNDPARMIFTAQEGEALNASLIDIGDRFRLVVNEVVSVTPDADLPRLPVASVLWEPKPNLSVGAAAWIYTGAAHHSVYSQAVSSLQLEMLASMWDIEMILIDGSTSLRSLQSELRWNDVSFR